MSADGPQGGERSPRGWAALALPIALVVASVGCNRSRATDQDCAKILDRIVELEVRERGFRDPALLERKRAEMRQVLAPELKLCEGKRLKPGALACVQQATSSEQISHACLR